MSDHAFSVLGIPPSSDTGAIRAAYARLARIYHPDYLAGMPDDVRDEAERRMEEVAAAYELLRSRVVSIAPAPVLQETAAQQLEEERVRARWRRWDEIERLSREQAEREEAGRRLQRRGLEVVEP